jgi:hypothetical protein
VGCSIFFKKSTLSIMGFTGLLILATLHLNKHRLVQYIDVGRKLLAIVFGIGLATPGRDPIPFSFEAKGLIVIPVCEIG